MHGRPETETGGLHPALLPLDEHNRTLQQRVRPPDWTNPEPHPRYDLVVVGAGTAGLVTAAIAVALGARVALVERGLMGGDCLNVGCVPSKALLSAARAWHAAHTAEARFGGPRVADPGDFAAAMERMRRLRAQIGAHDSAARFRELGVDVFLGEGRFTGSDTVAVDGVGLRFRRAVIATGSRAAVPDLPGLAEAGYLTNETVFSLTRAPRHLVVLGGGPVGCELAQAFARFGSQVTLLQQGDRLLTHDDPDAARVVHEALLRDGVRVVTDAEAEAVEATGGGRRVRFRHPDGTETVDAEEVLVATGRVPAVEGLGLEAAGVRGGRGGVEVDDRMRTSNSRVYAVGDVSSSLRFTHAADAQARLVVQNALFFGRKKASDLVIPWCTYTSPELAHVGITAQEAADRGEEVETVTIPMAEVDRARLDGETEGFLRVHLKRGSDHVLGATLVAEHAGEVISQLTAAITAGVGLGQLGQTVFPYPTQAEVIRKAADAWRRQRLTPGVKRGFEMFLRVMR